MLFAKISSVNLMKYTVGATTSAPLHLDYFELIRQWVLLGFKINDNFVLFSEVFYQSFHLSQIIEILLTPCTNLNLDTSSIRFRAQCLKNNSIHTLQIIIRSFHSNRKDINVLAQEDFALTNKLIITPRHDASRDYRIQPILDLQLLLDNSQSFIVI